MLSARLQIFDASAPEPEPTQTITISAVKDWGKNHESNKMINNGLTSQQLMEVIKLCISTGELKGVTVVEENAVLSYAVLRSTVTVSDIPLTFTFSCRISKNGTLRLRVTNVSETDPVKLPFKKVIKVAAVASYKENVVNVFEEKLQNFASAIVTRSGDFA